jgi:hypothetical protein
MSSAPGTSSRVCVWRLGLDSPPGQGDLPQRRTLSYLVHWPHSLLPGTRVDSVMARFKSENRWFGDAGLAKTRDEMMRMARKGPQKLTKSDAPRSAALQYREYRNLSRAGISVSSRTTDSLAITLRESLYGLYRCSMLWLMCFQAAAVTLYARFVSRIVACGPGRIRLRWIKYQPVARETPLGRTHFRF